MPAVLRCGSCAVCVMIVWCCRVACACPACDHDLLIFMYFVPFWRVSCFVCVIACVADMRAREVGGEWVRRVCRMLRDRSVGSSEMTGDMGRYYFAGGLPCGFGGLVCGIMYDRFAWWCLSLVYGCAFDARSFVALWHGLRMLPQSPLATRDACAPPRACRVACLGRVSCSECHLCVLPPLIGAVRACR